MSTPVQHMQIDGRCFQALVAQQFLNRTHIIAIPKQMRGKRVPEHMRTDPFSTAAFHGSLLNSPLDFLLGLMIAVNQTGSSILSPNLGREEVLPVEFG